MIGIGTMDTTFLLIAYFVGCFLGHVNIFLENLFLKKVKKEGIDIKKPIYRAILFGIIFAALMLLFDYRKAIYIFSMFFLCYLIAMVDLKGLIIPNKLVLTILVISVLSALLGVQSTNLLEAIFGFGIGFVAMAIPHFSGGPIGGGDVKLLAVIGFCVGFMGVLYIMIMVGFLNLLYIVVKSIITKSSFMLSMKDVVPMGPFIAISFLLFIIAQNIF